MTMHAWAATAPWECLTRPTRCISHDHKHDPMVGDQCAVPGCEHRFEAGEECFGVTERLEPRVGTGIPWVCAKHVVNGGSVAGY